MAATLKKHVESKYVTVFKDSEPDADITFRDDLLESPAENYQVGVDHLTVNAGAFSMFPDHGPGSDQVSDIIILEVLRLNKAGNDNAPGGDAANNIHSQAFPAAYRISELYQVHNDRPFTSYMQFLNALHEVNKTVNNAMNDVVTHQNISVQYPFEPVVIDAAGKYAGEVGHNAGTAETPTDIHLMMSLTPSGRLSIGGSRAFWSNYCIYVPNKYFQQIFFGRDRELMIINPDTGADADGAIRIHDADGANDPDFRNTLIGLPAAGLLPNYPAAVWDIEDANISATARRAETRAYMPRNLFCTLDRRVCLEVGTSLPIKGSPLVDHNISTSDFMLARYMMPMAQIKFDSSDDTFTEEANGVHRYADERIQYHSLKPQQKISQLRLRIFGRVRHYNLATKAWVHHVIKLPVVSTDYWSCRLHFVGKE